MPIIKVWCLPANQTEEMLNKVHQSIVSAVVGIYELGLKDENDMTCLFVPDLMSYGLGEEIIIEISGLFEKPERTQGVRQRLALNVGLGIKRLYPKAKVECFVASFNPENGFWTSADQPTKNPDCEVHGSIEHMQSADGKCPNCGNH
ncbi:hypothetical protein A2442_03080 [Candidatus Campbellbacteria bacterium RIFOXYC2_FULL_35_25]|uniref:4-oxalocrotonate tautomerase domain-containing protein n=1 Tax=Candidatus Campbellbacteria bacterium RIFOXYC2_FULL_35_25 TaxID=1797582 RepID=A0A1F5EJ97_9BACT|nr:MAG: hypothetical protein A2442_03080 [Candidatus Campbellbacteria bacterium RIFOXYC2_FULL_35_25]